MKITNKKGLPEGLVKANSVERHSTPNSLSVTSLLSGLKTKILTDRHNDEIEVDVSDLFWASFGTAFHKLCESEGKHDFAEVSIDFEMDGIKIRGRIDLYNMKTATVADYKTVNVMKWKYKDFDSFKQQGFIYAWLLRKNGFEAKECIFYLCFKDYSKMRAKVSDWYPTAQVETVSFNFTDKDFEETEKFVKEKIAEYKKVRDLKDDDIPTCSADERWHKKDSYAVYSKAKTGKNKGNWKQKADVVKDSYAEAEEYAKSNDLSDYEIRERKGEDTKCIDYCNCCDFCNYYKEHVSNQTVVSEEE